MQGYEGWAIFADGDMLCMDDIAKLWALQDDSKAVMVVKHNYQSRFKEKYVGTSLHTCNVSYPRKNWSSVVLWNCSHPANKALTPEYVMSATGRQLHRFEHLKDEEIGELPMEWNWLVTEYEYNPHAKLAHYTLGVPGMKHYQACDYSMAWHLARKNMDHIQT